MNPYTAYRQQQTLGWTRIDMLLALYDRAVQRLEQALAAAQAGDRTAASELARRSQILVAGLASGVVPEAAGLPVQLLRLFEFVLYCLRGVTVPRLEDALRVLCKVREGFEGIRDEGSRLERLGEIPSLATEVGLEITA